jgi:hypothetical protein
MVDAQIAGWTERYLKSDVVPALTTPAITRFSGWEVTLDLLRWMWHQGCLVSLETRCFSAPSTADTCEPE